MIVVFHRCGVNWFGIWYVRWAARQVASMAKLEREGFAAVPYNTAVLHQEHPWVDVHGALKSLGNFVPLTSVGSGFHPCILTQIHLRVTLFISENKRCSARSDYRVIQML